MQETWVQSLIWEDPTGGGAQKPVRPQLPSLCSRARVRQLLSPRSTEPVPHVGEAAAMTGNDVCVTTEKPRSSELEESRCAMVIPSMAKNK